MRNIKSDHDDLLIASIAQPLLFEPTLKQDPPTVKSPFQTRIAAAAFALLLISEPAFADLQLYWKLDENSGTTATDSSGNGIDGIWQETAGEPSWMPAGGIDGGSVHFSGIGLDSFITTDFTAVTGTPFTVSAWVKTTSTGNNGTVYLGDGNTGSSYYVVRVQDGTGKVGARNTSEYSGIGSTIVNDGKWHHLLAVYAGTDLREIYIDGLLEATSSALVDEVNLNRFGIGALTRNTPYAPADRFTGQIDEVALWDRAFGPADAAALNGLVTLGLGNAGDLEAFMTAFDSQGSVLASGRTWAFASGLTGTLGETGGSGAGKDAFIILDESGNGMQLTNDVAAPLVEQFAATPPTIFLGENADLIWTLTDAVTAEINQGVGVIDPVSGSVTVSPDTTTTYTLTADNPNGNVTRDLTVTVIAEPLITSFSSNLETIINGESVTLTWEVGNFTTLEIDQGVGTVTGAMGSITLTPEENTTYTLTATNPNGTDSATVDVEVKPVPPKRELLLHWALDEGAGTTAGDSVAMNDGIFEQSGGEILWDEGLIGNGLQFPHLENVSVKNKGVLVENYPFSISIWVQSLGSGNDTVAVLGTGVFDQYYSLRVNAGKAMLTRRHGAFSDLTGPNVDDGEWHQLVGVFHAADQRTLYVDGMMVGESNTDSGDFTLPDRFAIGALDRTDTSIVDPFGGRLDEAGFWRGSLNANDVAVLDGAGRLGLNTSDIAAMLDAFESGAGIEAGGIAWTYRSGLEGAVGTTSGSVIEGNPVIVMDTKGNGLSGSPARFSIIGIVQNESNRTLTWTSSPGASYRIFYSPDLVDWSTEVADGVPSSGSVTSYSDTDASRLAAGRGFYRVILE